MFAESTLLDNCGAMHVVNDRNKLEKGTFRETTDDYLEAGTTSFPISGRGTRIIRNVINGNDGHNTKDLILHDVAVVEGFHVNIVSESRLVDQNVWYLGADSSLRYGTIENNRIVAKLWFMFRCILTQEDGATPVLPVFLVPIRKNFDTCVLVILEKMLCKDLLSMPEEYGSRGQREKTVKHARSPMHNR
ncbi:hypothetical protein E4U52_007991 [Claviceps spartinae]|nr:hypothetical protein E4U52_007991 [Claviceps spartinae]